MKVAIMMGPAGCGKSTFIKNNFPDAMICSADSFHMVDGEYVYKQENARKAHASCLNLFEDHTRRREVQIVVDNTNTTMAQVAPYMALALARDYEVEVHAFNIDPEYAFKRTIHGVPLRTIYMMWFEMKQLLRDWPAYWPKPNVIDVMTPPDVSL